MIVRIRGEAEAELESAFDFYESRSTGLGHRFLNEYVRGTRIIAEAPNRQAMHPADERARRYLFDHFPFSIVYQIHADHVMVVAVASAHQRPGYWANRLRP